MWLFFRKKKGDIERNKHERDHNNKQITTATTSAGEEGTTLEEALSRGRWKKGKGRTTETNMAVSFTVYSSTPETWYKAIGFCLLGLSFHSSHRRGV